MKNVPIPEVYIKPSAPRSNWEIFQWLFFEPLLLDRWAEENHKDYWGNIQKFLFIYCCYFVPIIITCWAFMITVFVCLDTLNEYSEIFGEAVEIVRYSLSTFNIKWFFIAEMLVEDLAKGLALGLVLGIILVAQEGLSKGLILGGAISLALGLCMGLPLELAFGLGFGLGIGLAAGGNNKSDLGLESAWGWIFGLIASLIAGLVVGLVLASISGIVGIITFGLNKGLDIALLTVYMATALISGILYIQEFRPFYIFKLFKKFNLTNNPFVYDQKIRINLPWVINDLNLHAKREPKLALHFVNFLLSYRPLQQSLAAKIEHTATAALWRSELRLYSHIFESRHYLEEALPEKWQKFSPSSAWREKIRELRETLRSMEATTAIVAQQSLLQSCSKLIEEFEAINLRESFQGREEYFAVIEHWKQVLGNQLQEVAEKVAASQAITYNPYSKGNALTPTLVASSPLFLDRTDIKEELSLKIQTSAIMPTFLILGQRRVGKTSLLNFLPRLLDPNLYDVVVVDAQGLSGESSLLEWLKFWRKRIESQLRLPSTEPASKNNPLQAWDQFATFLDDLAQKRQRRLILAMDEYDEERGLHYAIRQDPELGAAFLGRMRAFAQQQKLVVFLFVGASYFSDLPEPKWSKYFVQTHIVRVDYLSEAASMQLIEQPVPNFALRYAPGIAEQIYQLTQGHPHLLHSICSDLVDYANIKVKNPIEQSDLEYILRHNIVLRGEQPFSVFWDEFCATEAMQVVVKAIAFGQSVDPQQTEVRKLADYGYILPNGDGSYRMRVPLFADWVRKFGY
jgi:hypothetical protein